MKGFIHGISFLEELPRKCPVCDAPLRFSYKSPKGYEYYGLKCSGSPSHESNFGQKKDGGELYYKGQWEEAYKSESPTEGSEPPPYEDKEMPF